MLLISCYCAHISSFYGDFFFDTQPHAWPVPPQCWSPPCCSPAMHLQAFVGYSESVRRMCECVCLLCAKEGGGRRRGGGIDFWWIEGVLFLLYMRQKTPWHVDLRGEHSLLNVQCKKTRQWKSLTGDSLDDIWYPCVPNVNNCFHLSAISPQDFFKNLLL